VSASFIVPVRRPSPGLLASALARHGLDLAHVEAALDDVVGEFFGVRLPDQHARVTGAELAGGDVGLHLLRQLQEPHHVGDVAAALADDLGDVVLRMVELGGQHLIAGRFLQRVEIGALHVLDDGKFERLGIGHVEHDHRHLVQPARCAARQRRSPAMIS
jgi:hypothetical protein